MRWEGANRTCPRHVQEALTLRNALVSSSLSCELRYCPRISRMTLRYLPLQEKMASKKGTFLNIYIVPVLLTMYTAQEGQEMLVLADRDRTTRSIASFNWKARVSPPQNLGLANRYMMY